MEGQALEVRARAGAGVCRELHGAICGLYAFLFFFWFPEHSLALYLKQPLVECDYVDKLDQTQLVSMLIFNGYLDK